MLAKEMNTVSGTVSVAKDKEGKITAVKLIVSEKEVYNVVLDEKGQKLGNDLSGKKAQVTGVVAGVGGVRTITIHHYYGRGPTDTGARQGEWFTCSSHPSVRFRRGESCPICGMHGGGMRGMH
ncbi:MAG: hypothetical protein A2107_06325 [Verrucomicrobia bacterium GWF2_62_7]|nr:MAG: hypothetical protein A2107_06325 [Verrucomicrobia bacterium GWF2_62_7]